MIEIARVLPMVGIAGLYFLIQSFFVFEVNDAPSGDSRDVHTVDGD